MHNIILYIYVISVYQTGVINVLRNKVITERHGKNNLKGKIEIFKNSLATLSIMKRVSLCHCPINFCNSYSHYDIFCMNMDFLISIFINSFYPFYMKQKIYNCFYIVYIYIHILCNERAFI